MFQRLKGAIDTRIAEEQARQRASNESPNRGDATTRRSESTAASNARSPASHPRRKKDGEPGTFPNGKPPNPDEFEPEFVVGDDETPDESGSTTPHIKTEDFEKSLVPGKGADEGDKDKVAEAKEGEGVSQSSENAAHETPLRTSSTPVPLDMRKKLVRLEKLEPKYQELLRSYRIAHAKVLAIEPFEATLRENTPLTSIGDPGAFVEYLNQVNLKASMVMDELKRISVEKDELKAKVDTAERNAASAREELEILKAAQKRVSIGQQATDASALSPLDPKSPTSQQGSDALPSISALTSPVPEAGQKKKEDNEDFFSYESEVPRLHAELRESESKINKLELQREQLKSDLASAQESAEQLVQNLETATLDLQNLRDAKVRAETESAELRKSHHDELVTINAKLEQAEKQSEDYKDAGSKHEDEVARLKSSITSLEGEIDSLRSSQTSSSDQNAALEKLQTERTQLQGKLAESEKWRSEHEKRSETVNKLVIALRSQLATVETDRTNLVNKVRALTEEKLKLDAAQETAQDALSQAYEPATNGAASIDAGNTAPTISSRKKNNKKKKKGGKGGSDTLAPTEASRALTPSSLVESPTVERGADGILPFAVQKAELEARIAELEKAIEDKDAAINRLTAKLKDQDDLKEEIEGLKQDLLDVGSEHVSAKDELKKLQAEKAATAQAMEKLEKEISELRTSHVSSKSTSKQERANLMKEFEGLKTKADSLEVDLAAAQQLAQTRFKDLTDLREVLQKAQPELTSLRKESVELKSVKESLASKSTELRKLEGREKDLKMEIVRFKSQIQDNNSEIATLSEKLAKATREQSSNEDAIRQGQRDFQRVDSERRDAVETRDRLHRDYTKAQEELRASRESLRSFEKQVEKLTRDGEAFRDDLGLKNAQYASAQSLMTSMQDQTQEMSAQMKEVRERCESLEEELADAHRLLSERSREGETMRRLLADVEGRAEARIKEMRERMDLAMEERDRAEEQAKTLGKRRDRELEELKNKAREAERDLRRAIADKEDVEATDKELRRQKEELERRSAKSAEEVAEVRQAMSQLREALDDGERQTRQLEKEKADLRKVLDETQQRLEKVQKSSKLIAEELKVANARVAESVAQSSRSSLEISSPARMTSPLNRVKNASNSTMDGVAAGAPSGQLDVSYLKNVLLQFLEQRDKKHQIQLVPVLGMLLKFDKKDEQKWMSVISAKVM